MTLKFFPKNSCRWALNVSKERYSFVKQFTNASGKNIYCNCKKRDLREVRYLSMDFQNIKVIE